MPVPPVRPPILFFGVNILLSSFPWRRRPYPVVYASRLLHAHVEDDCEPKLCENSISSCVEMPPRDTYWIGVLRPCFPLEIKNEGEGKYTLPVTGLSAAVEGSFRRTCKSGCVQVPLRSKLVMMKKRYVECISTVYLWGGSHLWPGKIMQAVLIRFLTCRPAALFRWRE